MVEDVAAEADHVVCCEREIHAAGSAALNALKQIGSRINHCNHAELVIRQCIVRKIAGSGIAAIRERRNPPPASESRPPA